MGAGNLGDLLVTREEAQSRFEELAGITIRDVRNAGRQAETRKRWGIWVYLVPQIVKTGATGHGTIPRPRTRTDLVSALGTMLAWYQDAEDARLHQSPIPPSLISRLPRLSAGWHGPDPEAARLARTIARLLRELCAGVPSQRPADHPDGRGLLDGQPAADDVPPPSDATSDPQAPTPGDRPKGAPSGKTPAVPGPPTLRLPELSPLPFRKPEVTWRPSAEPKRQRATPTTARAAALREELCWFGDQYDQLRFVADDLEAAADFFGPKGRWGRDDRGHPPEPFPWLCRKAAEALLVVGSASEPSGFTSKGSIEKTALFVASAHLADADEHDRDGMFINFGRLCRRVKQALFRTQ